MIETARRPYTVLMDIIKAPMTGRRLVALRFGAKIADIRIIASHRESSTSR